MFLLIQDCEPIKTRINSISIVYFDLSSSALIVNRFNLPKTISQEMNIFNGSSLIFPQTTKNKIR